MKMTQSVRWLAVLALSIPALAQAADEPAKKPTPPPLISLDDLQKRLGDPHLRLLDVRAEAKYKQGQLPGAVWVDVKVFQPLLKPDSITSKEAWASGLASLGIDDQAEVYVYDDDRQHIAGKVWWLLSYAGVARVGLIDGGIRSGNVKAVRSPRRSPQSSPMSCPSTSTRGVPRPARTFNRPFEMRRSRSSTPARRRNIAAKRSRRTGLAAGTFPRLDRLISTTWSIKTADS